MRLFESKDYKKGENCYFIVTIFLTFFIITAFLKKNVIVVLTAGYLFYHDYIICSAFQVFPFRDYYFGIELPAQKVVVRKS